MNDDELRNALTERANQTDSKVTRSADDVFAAAQVELDGASEIDAVVDATPASNAGADDDVSATAPAELDGASEVDGITAAAAGSKAARAHETDDETDEFADLAAVTSLAPTTKTIPGGSVWAGRILAVAAALMVLAGGAFLVTRSLAGEPGEVAVGEGDDNDGAAADSSDGDSASPPEAATPTSEDGPGAGEDPNSTFDSPFPECSTIWESGDPVVEPDLIADRATLTDLRRRLQTEVMEDRANEVFSMGGPENVFGRISVGMTRNQATIEKLLAIVNEPEFGDVNMVCLELPPADFDDGPEIAVWTVSDASLPISENWENLVLLVDDPHGDCGHNPEGRIQEPTVTYTDTEVIIEILLDGIPFGGATCEGWGPVEVTVALSEDPGDRELVNTSSLDPKDNDPDDSEEIEPPEDALEPPEQQIEPLELLTDGVICPPVSNGIQSGEVADTEGAQCLQDLIDAGQSGQLDLKIQGADGGPSLYRYLTWADGTAHVIVDTTRDEMSGSDPAVLVLECDGFAGLQGSLDGCTEVEAPPGFTLDLSVFASDDEPVGECLDEQQLVEALDAAERAASGTDEAGGGWGRLRMSPALSNAAYLADGWNGDTGKIEWAFPRPPVADLTGERVAEQGPVLLWWRSDGTVEAWLTVPGTACNGPASVAVSVAGNTRDRNATEALSLILAVAQAAGVDLFQSAEQSPCPSDDQLGFIDVLADSGNKPVHFYCGLDRAAETLAPADDGRGGGATPTEVLQMMFDGPPGYTGLRPNDWWSSVPMVMWGAPISLDVDDSGLTTINIDYDFASAPVGNFGTSNMSSRYLRQLEANLFQFEEIKGFNLAGLCCGEWGPNASPNMREAWLESPDGQAFQANLN